MPRRGLPPLPIKLTSCSNGEFSPEPTTPFVREVAARSMRSCDEIATRLGMDRRRFLRSSMASAVTLLTLGACSRESRSADAPSGSGGTFDIPTTATTEPDVAVETFTPPDVVVDVQNHFLEYDLSRPGRGFGGGFPQARCGEDDPRACFSAEWWRSLVLDRSETSIAVLSAIPVTTDPDPLSIEVMDAARRTVEALCDETRVLVQGHAVPNIGDIAAARELMLATADSYDLAAWKVYTHAGPGFRLDDGDPDGLQVGQAFIDAAVASGVPIIAVHKGFGGGNPWASPADIGPAAVANPDVAFLVYHSGYEAGNVEGPYDPDDPEGVDRLVRSLADAGIGPGANVYAELGSTWRSVMVDVDQAADLLGKLLLAVGPDRVLWGTDSIWYGTPQDQIQAFRTFTISEEFQDRFGYPALTDDVKAKILGRNAAVLHGIDTSVFPCADPAAVEETRLWAPDDVVLGPTDPQSARLLFAREHPWFR